LLVWWAAPGPDLLRAGLAVFTLIGALWITQAIHLVVTALLVPLVAVVWGLLPVQQALVSFSNPIIFLFLGGFALAAALSQHGLDRALASWMLRLAKGQLLASVLLLAGLTAFLSMWMSNTATVAMMLPLALGLLRSADAGHEMGAREYTFVLLALAYSASIGGIGSIVGSPPNAIAAAHTGMSFAQWLAFGLPLVFVLWPLMLVILWGLLRPNLSGRISFSEDRLDWTWQHRATTGIFMLTVLAWIFSTTLSAWTGITKDMDTVIALTAVVLLLATRVLDWPTLQAKVQWGVLLLFGGGLALSEVMVTSGASRFLADALLLSVAGLSVFWVILAVLLLVIFMTELVSNTASAALLIPLLMPVAVSLDRSPMVLAFAIAAAASCAFMLPVATPPNALVFATDRVPQSTMMRCGLWLNLAGVLVIGLFAYGLS